MIRLVALISGRGSNLQAVIDALNTGQIAAELVAVISNNPTAVGLERARQVGIPIRVVNHRNYPDRRQFDSALHQTIEPFAPDVVILAGFMRILGADFVNQYHGRLLNIHPSLLPAYRGLNTHARVIAAGETEHGVSVHFVTPELDGGPVIACAKVRVLPDDNPEHLAARVLVQEHRLYPAVIGWFAAGRICLHNQQVYLDDNPLYQPVEIDFWESSCEAL